MGGGEDEACAGIAGLGQKAERFFERPRTIIDAKDKMRVDVDVASHRLQHRTTRAGLGGNQVTKPVGWQSNGMTIYDSKETSSPCLLISD